MADIERRLWRIDLNAIRVKADDGRDLEVTEAVGVLDGELSVSVRLPTTEGAVDGLIDDVDTAEDLAIEEEAFVTARVLRELREKLTAMRGQPVTAPSVITARADVDLVERMRRQMALGTDEEDRTDA